MDGKLIDIWLSNYTDSALVDHVFSLVFFLTFLLPLVVSCFTFFVVQVRSMCGNQLMIYFMVCSHFGLQPVNQRKL